MNRLTRSVAVVTGALLLATASMFAAAQQVTKLKTRQRCPPPVFILI